MAPWEKKFTSFRNRKNITHTHLAASESESSSAQKHFPWYLRNDNPKTQPTFFSFFELRAQPFVLLLLPVKEVREYRFPIFRSAQDGLGQDLVCRPAGHVVRVTRVVEDQLSLARSPEVAGGKRTSGREEWLESLQKSFLLKGPLSGCLPSH